MERIGIVGASGQLGASLMKVLSVRGLPMGRSNLNLEEAEKLIWAAGTSKNLSSEIAARKEFCEIKASLNDVNFKQLQKVVLVSSGGTIYGNQHNHPRVETDAVNPKTPYANLKYRVEEEFKNLCKVHGFSLVILRLANVFSAYGKGLISNLLKNAGNGQSLTLYVNPNSRKQYGHSDDYAKLIVRYMEELDYDSNPRLFNLFSPYSYSIREIINLVERIAGVQLPTNSSGNLLPLDSVELASLFPDFIHSHKWLSIEDFVQQEIERYKE